jgi:hypothetical protein
MKEGSLFVLFCFLVMRSTRMLQIVFLVSMESSQRGGVHVLGSMMFGPAVQKLLNIEWFLHWKIKLNCSWNFWRKWNVPLVLLERSWWEDLMEFIWWDLDSECGRYWFFKWFLPLKIQINSEKSGFGRKISWGRGNTWANGTCHTSQCEYYSNERRN